MHWQHQQRTSNEEQERQRVKERELQGRSGKNTKSFSHKKPQPSVVGASA